MIGAKLFCGRYGDDLTNGYSQMLTEIIIFCSRRQLLIGIVIPPLVSCFAQGLLRNPRWKYLLSLLLSMLELPNPLVKFVIVHLVAEVFQDLIRK